MQNQDTEKTELTHPSHLEPFRNTVGHIYRESQIHGDKSPIECGNMTEEIMKGYVEDLNEAFMIPEENPFYVMLTEKKDLQMKSALCRKIVIFKNNHRPWPEDNTTVFWKNPKTQEIRFCWDLPHWSEMDNILANKDKFDITLVAQIIAWKNFDLYSFGFIPLDIKKDRWISNINWKDKTIKTI